MVEAARKVPARLSAPEQVFEGFPEVRKFEGVPFVQKPPGNGVLSFNEDIPEFSQDRADDKSGNGGKKNGFFQNSCQGAGQLFIRDRVGGGDIHRPRDMLMFREKQQDVQNIFLVDPGKRLPSAAQGASQHMPEGREHSAECAALAAEYDAEPAENHSYPERLIICSRELLSASEMSLV